MSGMSNFCTSAQQASAGTGPTMPGSGGTVSCLQQRTGDLTAGYSCMARSAYDPLTTLGGYSRPCSPGQPYQTHQYATAGGGSSTGMANCLFDNKMYYSL